MSRTTRFFFLAGVTALALPLIAAGSAPLRANDKIAAAAPPCTVPAGMTRLRHALPRTGQRLAHGETLTIVAIGSSSTAGAGASASANSYPSRLAVELQQKFPISTVTVHNRGANGEQAHQMRARFEADVFAANPDLVLWQVGTNSLLLDQQLDPAGRIVREGLMRLKERGIDVVIVDPQFAPKVLAKPNLPSLLELLGEIADKGNVGVFPRFAVMRHWKEVAGIPFSASLSPDELHMNDWSYGCVARLMAESLAEAAARSMVSATATAPRR